MSYNTYITNTECDERVQAILYSLKRAGGWCELVWWGLRFSLVSISSEMSKKERLASVMGSPKYNIGWYRKIAPVS